MRSPDVTRLVVLPLALSCLWAAPAPAATVDAGVRRVDGEPVPSMVFRAARGEENRLTVRFGDAATFRFTDRAAVVRPRGACRRIDRHQVSCPALRGVTPRILARDGDDRLVVRAFATRVAGGAGDDVLVGRRGFNRFDGGTGDDVLRGGLGGEELTGGPGRDVVSGGRGHDMLVDGERDAQAAPDRYAGGPEGGTALFEAPGDVVSYALRRRGVQGDLAGDVAAEDRLAGVENLVGGAGDDVLAGDDGPNLLRGGAGPDVLRGGRGRDALGGGDGDDRVFGDLDGDLLSGEGGQDLLAGGPGDDALLSHEAPGPTAADELACDDGSDTAHSEASDTLTGACERLQVGHGLMMETMPAVRPDAVTFAVQCFTPCRAALALTGLAGEGLGSATAGQPAPAGGTFSVTVPLTAAGAAAVGRGDVVRVHVGPDAATGFRLGGYRAVLPAPAP